jgi:hypothetical protein
MEEHLEETKQDVEPAICKNCKDKILEEVVADKKFCYTCYMEKIDTPRNEAVESKEIKTTKSEILN